MLTFAFCFSYKHQYFQSSSATSVKCTRKKIQTSSFNCNKQLKITFTSLFVNYALVTQNTGRMTNEFYI